MVLGIDASTKKTGYALLENENNILDYGLLISTKDYYIDRIQEIYIQLKDLIIKNDNINYIVIEDVPMNYKNNLKTARELILLQGLIFALSFTYNIPVVLYNPSAHRSLNGLYDGTREGMKRERQKQAAVDKVNELYGLNFKFYIRDTKSNKSDDDMAEAILIARALFLENKED